MTTDERITNLEIKLTYQDELVETLNQVVIELRTELAGLTKKVVELEQQLTMGIPETGPANDPPPHY
jgi:SlyX protein